MLTDDLWDKRLQCYVNGLDYDFRLRKGMLYMVEGSHCDGPGCVALFEGIDPEVKAIHTYSGDWIDMIYGKNDGKWEASMVKVNKWPDAGEMVTDRCPECQEDYLIRGSRGRLFCPGCRDYTA